MSEKISAHYSDGGDLANKIAEGMRSAGKRLEDLNPADLASIDEFHFRGRKATLELAGQMNLSEDAHVLDVGSGLGGPARTLAEEYGCRVTGIDLTAAFCEVAGIMSGWVKLDGLTGFRQGDATDLPFADDRFDAAITLHVSMNIASKDRMYAEVRRVLKPGGVFAVYDILQGEGGEAFYPAPWARDSSISHLATPDEMEKLLAGAGFGILDVYDSTDESLGWLESRTANMARSSLAPVTVQVLFGDDHSQMIANQVRGLRERRIRTVSFICEA
jgi:ubiquinone/menaquinone biosynthesis C-methylase UbiE